MPKTQVVVYEQVNLDHGLKYSFLKANLDIVKEGGGVRLTLFTITRKQF